MVNINNDLIDINSKYKLSDGLLRKDGLEVILLGYQAILKQMDEKKTLLAVNTPYLESLREKLLVEWTCHSNAIEGNTLTLSKTKVVLERITIGGKLCASTLK